MPISNPNHRLTIPDVLSLVRILGSFLLIIISYFQAPYLFVGVYLFLGFTDLIDGPIARWLKQESVHGAKLDSIADVLLSGSLLIGVLILCWPTFVAEAGWIFVAVSSYVLSLALCYFKFGKLPAFHTYAAKVNHFLVAIAGVCLILDLSVWPLRLAAVTTSITNLEIMAICMTLSNYQTDVVSLLRVSKDIEVKGKMDRPELPADVDQHQTGGNE